MVDVFPAIYDAVKEHMAEKFPALYMTGQLNDHPPKIPCLQLQETNNTSTLWDNHPTSDYAILQIRARVYTNKNGSKIRDARAIMAALDAVLEPLNCRCTSRSSNDGLYQNSAVRMEATYEVVADVNGNLYRTRQ